MKYTGRVKMASPPPHAWLAWKVRACAVAGPDILQPTPSLCSEKGVRSMLGWPNRCKRLAHPFLWEYSYARLKLAQLLGQLGVFHTCFHAPVGRPWRSSTPVPE